MPLHCSQSQRVGRINLTLTSDFNLLGAVGLLVRSGSFLEDFGNAFVQLIWMTHDQTTVEHLPDV